MIYNVFIQLLLLLLTIQFHIQKLSSNFLDPVQHSVGDQAVHSIQPSLHIMVHQICVSSIVVLLGGSLVGRAPRGGQRGGVGGRE